MLLLLKAPQTCTHLLAILKLSEYTYHGISHSVCAKHDNGVDCYDCIIPTRVNTLYSHRRDISLCMILHHAITLKYLEHS